MGWAVLSVTPGKAGELLKAYFIQYRLGTPISWSAPAVMAERLTDFISLICLAFLGMLIFESGAFYLVLGGAGIWFAVALKGISLPNAVAATFVIRVCTLWFGRGGAACLSEPV